MDCLDVQWDNKLSSELEEILKNRYISPKYNKDRYIVKITKEAKLECELNILADILIRAVNIGGFDTLHLDGFSSVALMYRVQKKGLPVYAVFPEPFKRTPLTKVSKTTSTENKINNASKTKQENNRQSIVLYKENGLENGEGSNRNAILFAAFVFFVAVVVAVMVARRNSRSGR
jgi:hypothetical protein